jgi:hypothetical protein
VLSNSIEPLTLDLIEWAAETLKPCAYVMGAWRTSCPRLTVWEGALDRGLVSRVVRVGGGFEVAATKAGSAALLVSGFGGA